MAIEKEKKRINLCYREEKVKWFSKNKALILSHKTKIRKNNII